MTDASNVSPSILRVVCLIAGVLLAGIVLWLSHPAYEIPVWFGTSCALAAVGTLVSALAIGQVAVRGIACVATVAAALALIPGLFSDETPLPFLSVAAYVVGMLCMAIVPSLVEARGRRNAVGA